MSTNDDETSATDDLFKSKKKTKKPKVPTSSFKVTDQIKLQIAEYLRDNFANYKAVGHGGKANFLRKMKDKLDALKGLESKQVLNAFDKIIRQYNAVKEKLNQSGFGVDPDVDKSLDKGWILKQCPHFNTLDEVFGTRPNITPPVTLSSSAFGEIPSGENNEDLLDIDEIGSTENSKEELKTPDSPSTSSNKDKKNSEDLSNCVKSTLQGVKRKSDQVSKSNGAIGAFTKIIGERIVEQKEVELKKLNLDTEKFEFSKGIEEKRIEIEILKINSQKDIELEKIKLQQKLEEKRFDDAKEQREFELKKLKLQIELEKYKSNNK